MAVKRKNEGHPNKFKPGDPRINRHGRPPVGLSIAEKVRAVVGADGRKLVDMWAAVGLRLFPAPDGTSSRAVYIDGLHSFSTVANLNDRLFCSKYLGERGFGKPVEQVEHSGEIAGLTRVVHEYHKQ